MHGDAKPFYLCTCSLSFSVFPAKRPANYTEEKQPQTSYPARTEYVSGKVVLGDLDGIFSATPPLSACLTHAYMIDRERAFRE